MALGLAHSSRQQPLPLQSEDSECLLALEHDKNIKVKRVIASCITAHQCFRLCFPPASLQLLASSRRVFACDTMHTSKSNCNGFTRLRDVFSSRSVRWGFDFFTLSVQGDTALFRVEQCTECLGPKNVQLDLCQECCC